MDIDKIKIFFEENLSRMGMTLPDLLSRAKMAYSNLSSEESSKKFVVSLDFGTTSIKLAQFERREKSLCLIKLALEEVGQEGGKKGSSEGECRAALKKILTGIDIADSDFVISLNCLRTAISTVVMPYMPENELPGALKLVAKNYFSFLTEGEIFDFEIIDQIKEGGNKKYKLLVGASVEKTIRKCLSLLAEFKINPVSIFPSAYALKQLVGVWGLPGDELQCFVCIGGNISELIVFLGKDLIFFHKINVTGVDFTKAMTGVFSSEMGKIELSFSEAEKLKREVGISVTEKTAGVDNRISVDRIHSMVRPPLEQLVNEIDQCLVYFKKKTDAGQITALTLLGGGSDLKGIDDFLSKELDMKVVKGCFLQGVNIGAGLEQEAKKNVHLYACAIAGALACYQKPCLNLIPPQMRSTPNLMVKYLPAIGIIAAAALGLIFVHGHMKRDFVDVSNKIVAAQTELSAIEFSPVETKKEESMATVLADEPYWGSVLKELSNIIPEDIRLDEVGMDNKIIVMRGTVSSPDAELSLSKFIFSLDGGLFKDVRLIKSMASQGAQGSFFELTCGCE